MSDDLYKISLKQGKQFNTYQTKIKNNGSKQINTTNKFNKKEGFVSLEQEQMVRPNYDGYSPVLNNMQKNKLQSNNISKQALDELTQLQSQYDKLMQQYITIQKNIGESSLNSINRVSPNNPYLNKIIRFSTGQLCYVTNQGIAKYIPSKQILDSLNVSKKITDINIAWDVSYNTAGANIPTTPSLISGSEVKKGQTFGNEGTNVYASKLVDQATSNYVGCYNDKPAPTNINVVPIMNSSNNSNGFVCSASSIYLGSNSECGPWAAFDQNPNTFWHSEVSSETNYNSTSGMYEGTNGVDIVSVGKIGGEYLQISMPGSEKEQKITVKQYSLSPRLDAMTTRSPNSWFILGYKDNQWFQVDRQQNQSFTSATAKVYNVLTPGSFSSYILLIDKVGNDEQSNNRYCVQVAEWNMFMDSDSNEQRAMIFNNDLIGYTSFDKCQEYAVENGYNYFGLQDVQPDGTAACLVSNDIVRTKIFGNADNQTTSIPIWSSNTAGTGATYCYVTYDGKLAIVDNSGNMIWQSPNAPSDCIFGGYVVPSSVQGSFGGNCVGKPLNIDCGNPDPSQSYSASNIIGNLNSILQKKATEQTNKLQSNWSYNPLTEWSGEDPAYCCAKLVDYTYQCGGGPFKSGQITGGSNISFDCSNEVNNCVFFCMLQSDGNMCLCRGVDPTNNKGNIWCSMTGGKQKNPNPDWVATNGKFGRSYLKLNEQLGIGEWIGSDDGSLKLIMQSDGNLVLYSSEIKTGCKKIGDKIYGNNWVNAVYQLNNVGNKNVLGKIGYVDGNAELREYPSSMVSFNNNYQIYQNTDTVGNDLTSLVTSTQDECQNACNNTQNCAAYVYQGNSQTCFLKNQSAFPVGNKQQNNNVVMGIRNPEIKNMSKCPNKITNIDTIKYDNYLKGQPMTQDTQCNIPVVSHSEQIKYDDIKSKLTILGNDIVSKMENLYNKDNKIYEKLNKNAEQFKKDLAKYKQLNLKMKEEINLQNNNIEGMKNLNISDLNGMLVDSDIRVLQENYKYIMWSILAVGLLTVSINMIRK